MAVHSPHLDNISDEAIIRDILKLSGRMALDSDEGVEMPKGISARRYVADMNREMFEEASGQDLSDATMAELEDAIYIACSPTSKFGWVTTAISSTDFYPMAMILTAAFLTS